MGFFCLYELKWVNWVLLREQVLVLTCSIFYFSATMATAPYNYSYIFKYIIIGKQQGAHSCGCCVWIHEKLCHAAFSLCLSHLSSLRSPHCSTASAFTAAFCIINLKGFRIYVEGTSADGKPLHEAHKPQSGCIFVLKCCFQLQLPWLLSQGLQGIAFITVLEELVLLLIV